MAITRLPASGSACDVPSRRVARRKAAKYFIPKNNGAVDDEPVKRFASVSALLGSEFSPARFVAVRWTQLLIGVLDSDLDEISQNFEYIVETADQ